ncbi:siderophore-interacting protein [Mycobacterium sp. 852013-50091_SCH5140682]|uniref:sigma-54-dependent Fis family transcriptional regulator n=1 Tax=Mycobacterium sp. 852013-50091_SCH5140682 TaxID=1834109 RepID=UPI0007EBF392|nr:helix-turn-helix domain-containing protein [Mycobacterium sp. 852013-50091_SCH5140682]OBC08895.1 siderophore-interacting protein [Mycobacterium sp. 852013-50091_SCH5140682]
MANSVRTGEDLRRAREEFLANGAAHSNLVTPDVLNSWRRSQALDVHPDRVDLSFVREPDPDTPLLAAATPVLRRIASDLADQAVGVILTSADGVVLDRTLSDPAIMRALDDVRLARGYSYAEEFAGTNGIGTTLETGVATFIRGSEHYVGTLERLACAGSPIRDPVIRRVLGVVDLTCWARQSDPLLFVLAKSAGSQIEDRLTALRNERETALLDSYLKHTRRYPGGVLAIGGEVVLMNPHLRQTLDAVDQSTLLDHAAEMVNSRGRSTTIASLPSGITVRITLAEMISERNANGTAVLHVHLNNQSSFAQSASVETIPRLAGRSSSWLRSCQQVSRCCRDRDWVVIEGECGSGRARLGQAVAQHVNPSRTVRILRFEGFHTTESFIAELDAETEGDDFAVVLANVDTLPDDALDPLSTILQTCAGRGWVAATMGTDSRSPRVDALLLPFFTHTVTVPALRHRIEDLYELVPALLRELTRGADVRLAPEAMRQLTKLPWSGNVAQLRKVLAETVSLQRTGTIGADKLPAECRSVSRRRLTQLEALERDAIVRSLQENFGSKSDAAEALGMSRATIYRKIKEFGIA